MKIVVAYSGGLDTSIILTWLKDKYDAEIIAFCADIGQEEELKGLDKKALKTGASKCYVDDLTEEFARDFIFPMIRANARLGIQGTHRADGVREVKGHRRAGERRQALQH